jgi:hypothetical protein
MVFCMQTGAIKHLSDAQSLQEQLSHERRAREIAEVRTVAHAVHLRVYLRCARRLDCGAGSSQQCSRSPFLKDRSCDEPLRCV